MEEEEIVMPIIHSTSYDKLENEYRTLWNAMKIRDEWTDRIEDAARGILGDKDIYSAVQSATGVPWFVIGILHQMESTRNFRTHLHNGDPLSGRTINVPAGRPTNHAPPFKWDESAIDAVRLARIDQTPSFSVERVAYLFESFNGFRSRNEHDIFTPYLWSGTEHYTKGKFVRDNVFDPNAVSRQVGCMPILAQLIELDDSVADELADSRRPNFVRTPNTMDLDEVQTKLGQIRLYEDTPEPPQDEDGVFDPGKVDTIFGQQTRNAVRALLVKEGVTDSTGWRDDRLFIAAQQALLRRLGVQIGDIDGIAGPITKWGLERYADFKAGKISREELVAWRDKEDSDLTPTRDPGNIDEVTRQPKTGPKPVWPTQAEIRSQDSIFGEHGVEGRPYRRLTKLVFPYPMRLAWDKSTVVRSTQCHELIHAYARRALENVLDAYGLDQIQELRLDLFGGCPAFRRIRGGSTWSMHAWAIAFDFDPARNGLNTHSRTIPGRHSKSNPPPAFADPIYNKWFEAWEDEGAISLGRERDYDWMHIQFARL